MNLVRLALATLGLAALAACGSAPLPPPPPGTPLDVHAVEPFGPRVPNESIFAAADLPTLRSLIDATDSVLAGQLGGAAVRHVCAPPYTADGGPCWPGVTSQPGRAYVALQASTGFCTTVGDPRLALSGTHLELQIPYTQESGCHFQGSVAAPSSALYWFPTGGLKPGLYSLSFAVQSSSDTYRSDATYLSIPGPAAGTFADMDREAADALAGVVGNRRAGLFSLSRVDGAQLAGLCGQTVAGPAYLVTYEPDQNATRRQMAVVLAGPTPRTCATTRI